MVEAFTQVLWLLVAVAVLGLGARWLPWPWPITYTMGGLGLGLLPVFPKVELDPNLFFVAFLPPLLFSDGWLISLRELGKVKRPVFLLAVGLVVATTVVVGLVAHALVPGLPLLMAFALGAIISPTDAVAVAAITEKLKVPARVTAVLNGESMLNDATGLVGFKMAIAAVTAGTFSLTAATGQFVVVALGGIVVGLVVGVVVGALRGVLIRARSEDPYVEVTLSLLTPYAAYLAGVEVGVSGILAIVSAGLYSGWRDPLRMSVTTRQLAYGVWATLLFWLNGLAFVLLGLQVPSLTRAVVTDHSVGDLVWFVAVISGAAMVVRMGWFFVGAYTPFLIPWVRRREERPPWQAIVVGGWAGMRGVVTLAGALSIPLFLPSGEPFPARDMVIFLSCGVIGVTLLIQGTTLEHVICRLGLREDGTLAREELHARTLAVQAGLEHLRDAAGDGLSGEEHAALGLVIAEYEHRLAELAAEGESRQASRLRLAAEKRWRRVALAGERAALDRLWSRGQIADETHRPLQRLLDLEEARLNEGDHRPPATEGISPAVSTGRTSE